MVIDYTIRHVTEKDKDNLKNLYLAVASSPGYLIRLPEEITDNYIDNILHAGLERGLALIVELRGEIIGSMIKYRSEVKAFSHVLTEGSILVHPDYQRKGIGSQLIKTFLDEVIQKHSDILRIELITRESNPAIKLYERYGFVQEGRLRGKVKNQQGFFEDDIPLAWMRNAKKLAEK